NYREIKLTEDNCAMYSTLKFVIVVKRSDLCSMEAFEMLRKHMVTPSMVDGRINWISTEAVMPSFLMANQVRNTEYMDNVMDKMMPLAMIVSSKELDSRRLFECIYEDPGAYQKCVALCDSIPKHTAVEFGSYPKTTDASLVPSNFIEDHLADDEVAIVFMSTLDTIHMLANNDYQLAYTAVTKFEGEVSLGTGKMSTDAVRMYSGPSMNVERYDPSKPTADTMGLRTSDAIMQEYRHILRMMLRFEKGDCGTDDQTPESSDTKFESHLMSVMTDISFPKGPGSVGLSASWIELCGIINTVVTKNYPFSLEAPKDAIWTMFVNCYMGNASACNISKLTVVDRKRKELKFHVKTNNPLTNLQLTGSKDSKTMCAYVMYLLQKICVKRLSTSKPYKLRNIMSAGEKCTICESGTNCAGVWSDAFTSPSNMIKKMTNKRSASQMTISLNYNQLALTEYNNNAGILGNNSTKGANIKESHKVGPPFNEALSITMENNKGTLFVTSDMDAVRVTGAILQACDSIYQYINEERHKVDVYHRDQCKDNKLETALTDNDGGMSKLRMGMLAPALIKSSVLTTICRIAMNENCRLTEYATKPSQGFQQATAAIAGKSMGVYHASKAQGEIRLKKYNVSPCMRQTGRKTDLLADSETLIISVSDVRIKTTSKFKCLNCVLAPAGSASAQAEDHLGGMEGMIGSAPSTNRTLSDKQRNTAKDSLMRIVSRQSNDTLEKASTLIAELVNAPLVSVALSMFNAVDLVMQTWDELMFYFVAGHLLNKYNYVPRANKHFDGINTPKFMELLGCDSVTTELGSKKFMSCGPTLVYLTSCVTAFESSESVRFVTCNILDVPNLYSFSGNELTSNKKVKGVFLPISTNVGGFSMDGNSAIVMDELVNEVNKLVSMSRVDRCAYLMSNAPSLLASIRLKLDIGDQDEREVPVTTEHVYEVFSEYGLDYMLDSDKYLLEIDCNLDNHEVMNKHLQLCRDKDAVTKAAAADTSLDVSYNSLRKNLKRKMTSGAIQGIDDDDDDDEEDCDEGSGGKKQKTVNSIVDQFIE
ncbi:hypothetical protein RRG08_043883, partial [Elysia crispata]